MHGLSTVSTSPKYDSKASFVIRSDEKQVFLDNEVERSNSRCICIYFYGTYFHKSRNFGTVWSVYPFWCSSGSPSQRVVCLRHMTPPFPSQTLSQDQEHRERSSEGLQTDSIEIRKSVSFISTYFTVFYRWESRVLIHNYSMRRHLEGNFILDVERTPILNSVSLKSVLVHYIYVIADVHNLPKNLLF